MSDTTDEGFTLMELLIALFIMAIVFGVMSAAFVISIQSSDESTTRLLQSRDGAITSAYFVKDVQSAETVSTTTAACPSASGQEVVSLTWTDVTAPQKVDYRYQPDPAGGSLTRYSCGATTREDVVASDLASKPVPTCISSCASAVSVTLSLPALGGVSFDLSASRRPA